jgi:energy-coupling factor transporter ATP-binding protein EcfA2
LQKGKKKMIEPLQHKQRQSAILLVEHALQFVATVVVAVVMMGVIVMHAKHILETSKFSNFLRAH